MHLPLAIIHANAYANTPHKGSRPHHSHCPSCARAAPPRELASGISEIVKYGLIRDSDLFCWLEANMPRLLARDPEAIAYAVERSCVNKAEVVAADEREGGVRATLNLGHTFGHAIETGTGYGALLHGEAVSTAMAVSAFVCTRVCAPVVMAAQARLPSPPQLCGA